MASSSRSVSFKVGGPAELLTDEFAGVGFPCGAVVKVLEIVEGGDLEGGWLIKVALGDSGIVAFTDRLQALEDLPPTPAAEVPDPPLAQPTRAPAPQGASSSNLDEGPVRVPQQYSCKDSMTLAAPRCRQMCIRQEPLMYFLLPSRLVCLRLWTKSEMGSYATNVVDAMLAIVHKQRMNIHRRDTPQGQCQILEQLHAEGVWRSEDFSAVASIECPDGSFLRAVGFASRLQDRTRAMHLSLATVLALELLKGGTSRLARATRQEMRQFPVLDTLVKQARWIKERADGCVPPPPTNEECYDFMRQLVAPVMTFHEDPDLWFSVGRVGGENL